MVLAPFVTVDDVMSSGHRSGLCLLILLGLIAGCSPEAPTTHSPLRIQSPIVDPTLNADSGAVTVEINVDTGQQFDDIEWDTLKSPPGGMAGIAEYDKRAVFRFNMDGTYVIRATGIRDDGRRLVSDTALLTVE